MKTVRLTSDSPRARWPYFRVVIVVTLLSKLILATLTPISFDFINLTHLAAQTYAATASGRLNFSGFYTGSGYVLAPFFGLWLSVPGSSLDISGVIGHYYMKPTPASWLLIFFVKLPIVAFDLISAITLLLIARRLGLSERSARFAAMTWLLNPFNSLMVDMWGQMDVVASALALAAVAVLMEKRYSLSSALFALSAFIRPVAFFLAIIVGLTLLSRSPRRDALAFWVPMAFTTALGGAFLMVGSGLGPQLFTRLIHDHFELFWFFGLPLQLGGSAFPATTLFLALVLYPIQAYAILRYWRHDQVIWVSMSFALLLAYFALSPRHAYYVTWITPLVTLSYASRKEPKHLPLLFFASAFLSTLFSYDLSQLRSSVFFVPNLNPAMQWLSDQLHAIHREHFDLSIPFNALFSATCLTYLIKTNLQNIREMSKGRSGAMEAV